MAETSNNIDLQLSDLEIKDITNLDLNTDNFDTSSFWKSRDETQQHSLHQKIFEISRFGPHSQLKVILDKELPQTIPIKQEDGSPSTSGPDVVSLTSQQPYRLNLDILDSSGWTPLIHASFNGHFEIVKEIINYQENKLKYEYKQQRMNENENENELKYKHFFKLFICRSVNWNGSSALHLSCARGHELIVKLLLNKMLFSEYKIDNKLSINALDFDSATPLHCAVLGKHYNIVEMLLLNNAITNQKDIRGKTAFDWAKERNMMRYIALFTKYVNANQKIQDPVMEDNDIPAKVVESIWEDQERKSMESQCDINTSNLILDMSPQTESSPPPPPTHAQTPGPGWYQGNNNNGNWNNNWNQNQNQGKWNQSNHNGNGNGPDQRQRAPRHIRYEQQNRNQQQYAQTPGPYGNYQNQGRHFNFPPNNNNNNNAWNQNQNIQNWNGNNNNNGCNQRWNNNNNNNNRWINNNRWNGNGNNNGQRWNHNNNNNWQQQQQQQQPSMCGMNRHQSVSPQLSTNNVTIPLPPLSISKSWDPCYSQQFDKNIDININSVPSKVSVATPKSDDEHQKAAMQDDSKCQETGTVKIRDKILSATNKVCVSVIEQKQLESVPVDGDEIKSNDKNGEDKEQDSTHNNALKFRNKYLSARCETLEKENESLTTNMKLETDKYILREKELSQQLDIKQKQIHELRHTMRKMRKFLDTLPIKLRRNFYKDNGNFNVEKSESDSERDNNDINIDKKNVIKKEYDDSVDVAITNEAIKHTSKGWKTRNNNSNNKRLYRNNDRKYGRRNNNSSMDEGWRRKR